MQSVAHGSAGASNTTEDKPTANKNMQRPKKGTGPICNFNRSLQGDKQGVGSMRNPSGNMTKVTSAGISAALLPYTTMSM